MADQYGYCFHPIVVSSRNFHSHCRYSYSCWSCFIAMVYIRIHFVVRRHNRQIHTLQVQHGTQTGEKGTLCDPAFSTFYVYLLFLICYLPHLICMAVIENLRYMYCFEKVFLLSLTLVFLNSVLNPVIYCWKMRHIRHVRSHGHMAKHFCLAQKSVIRQRTWHPSTTEKFDNEGFTPKTRQMFSVHTTLEECKNEITRKFRSECKW